MVQPNDFLSLFIIPSLTEILIEKTSFKIMTLSQTHSQFLPLCLLPYSPVLFQNFEFSSFINQPSGQHLLWSFIFHSNILICYL